jgi:hypothetical protein
VHNSCVSRCRRMCIPAATHPRAISPFPMPADRASLPPPAPGALSRCLRTGRCMRTRIPPPPAPGALSGCLRTRIPSSARPRGPFPMPADLRAEACPHPGPFLMPASRRLPPPGPFPDAHASPPPPAPWALSRCPRTRINAATRPRGPFPIPADMRQCRCPPLGPFPDARGRASPLLPAHGPFPYARGRASPPPGPFPDAPRCTSPPPPAPGALSQCQPFPNARGSASPLRMHVPADAHPQGPFPMSAGGRQRGRVRAALACRPPPGGFGVHRTTTISLRVAVCLWAALACVRMDRRPRGPATAIRLRAALGCVRRPATAVNLRAAWACVQTLPGNSASGRLGRSDARQTCPEADGGCRTLIILLTYLTLRHSQT